jgi:RimJ/RimL family protein N-acetyltransferase
VHDAMPPRVDHRGVSLISPAGEQAGPEQVTLRDGSIVLIRPIAPEDKDVLARGFEQMSEESRYKRFLGPMNHLGAKQLAYLTEVDHVDHEALAAVAPDGEPVGVVRYVREIPGSDVAEVAATVVDHWQGRGVATALLSRIAQRAREAGILRFTATCLTENREVIALLRELGPARVTTRGDGTTELRIELPARVGYGAPLSHVLRNAAADRLSASPRPLIGDSEPAEDH